MSKRAQVKLLVTLGGAAWLLAGCASSRVAEPAQAIAKAVAAFQADLSSFQQSTRELQRTQASLASGNDVSRKVADHSLEQLRTEQALIEAASFDDMLKILTMQADARVSALISPSSVQANGPAASMPIQELSSTANIVQKIARPARTREELQFLLDFANRTNAHLSGAKKQQPEAQKP